MALNKGKHIVAELEGVRCSIVETAVSMERVKFLKEVLEGNGYEVKTEQEKDKDGNLLPTYIIGVTDLLFNPMIQVYEQKLFRKDGIVITPAFWNQWPENLWELPYWKFQR
jgi:hypothetical protein